MHQQHVQKMKTYLPGSFQFQPRLALEDHEVATSLLQLHLAEVYDKFGLRKKKFRVPVRAITVIKSHQCQLTDLNATVQYHPTTL